MADDKTKRRDGFDWFSKSFYLLDYPCTPDIQTPIARIPDFSLNLNSRSCGNLLPGTDTTRPLEQTPYYSASPL